MIEHEVEFEVKLGDADRSFVAWVRICAADDEPNVTELDERLEEPDADGGVNVYCDVPNPPLSDVEEARIEEVAVEAFWDECQSAQEAAEGA